MRVALLAVRQWVAVGDDQAAEKNVIVEGGQ
jgi:hypothetical protein